MNGRKIGRRFSFLKNKYPMILCAQIRTLWVNVVVGDINQPPTPVCLIECDRNYQSPVHRSVRGEEVKFINFVPDKKEKRKEKKTREAQINIRPKIDVCRGA